MDPSVLIANSVESVDATALIGLLFCGAISLLSFFVTFIFIKTKERIYFYYLLFLLFSLLEAAFFLKVIVWEDSFVFQLRNQKAGLEFFTLSAFSAYSLFSLQLLDIKSQNKRLYYWISSMGYGGVMYAVVYLIVAPTNYTVVFYTFIASRLVILIMSIVAITWIFTSKIQSPVKNLFLAGSCFYFLGALVGVFRGVIPNIPMELFYELKAETYFQIGVFLQILSFTLALTYRQYLSYELWQENQLSINVKAIYEKEIAQAEALSWRIQVNPHFLFNYLNVIKYHMQIDKNEKAIEYLVNFSKYLRKILDHNQRQTVTLKQELDLIEHYLSLEAIRLVQDVRCDLDVDENVDINQCSIPLMLIHPFVEDALRSVKYNGNTEFRTIEISVNSDGDFITIIVEEEGTAVMDSELSQTSRQQKEYNRKITTERIALYNKKEAAEIKFRTLSYEELIKEKRQSKTIIKMKCLN